MRFWVLYCLIGLVTAVFVTAWQLQSLRHDLHKSQREIAVLLCSHHWQDDQPIRHEPFAVYRECVQAYEATGRVP